MAHRHTGRLVGDTHAVTEVFDQILDLQVPRLDLCVEPMRIAKVSMPPGLFNWSRASA